MEQLNEAATLPNTPSIEAKQNEIPQLTKRQRKHRGKAWSWARTLHFPAIPVRGLWDKATEEERLQAREIAMTIMEAWVGRITRAQAASKLGMRPIRFWQMSHQAMAGMMAGVLTQPRRRQKTEETGMTEQEEIKMLRKQVKDLQLQLEAQERLLTVLKSMPSVQPVRAKDESTVLGAAEKKGRRTSSRNAKGKPATNSQST